MHKLYRAIFTVGLAYLLTGTALAGIPAEQEAEIQYLLEFVANSGCLFIRNGSENDSEAAADHLRLKYRKGKRYFNTSEQFIDRLASESSWTGKKYQIKCNGEVSESGVWLHHALDEYRNHPVEQTEGSDQTTS